MTAVTTATTGDGVPAGRVPVTVVAGDRRVDLSVPAAVPVAELLPELARGVGRPGAAPRLVTSDGRELDGAVGLAAQGVPAGAVLAVEPPAAAPPRHDDPAEALAWVVARDLPGWGASARRRTTLAAGAALLALGAAVLATTGGRTAGGVAAGLAVGLLVAALVRSRRGDDPRSGEAGAVVCAVLATAYAAAAGVALAPQGPVLGVPAAAAGGAAGLVGVVGVLGLARGRPLLLPPVVVGAVLLATAGPWPPALVLTGVTVLVVLLAGGAPALAIGLSGSGGEAMASGEPGPVDLDALAVDARLAHELVVAVTVSLGLLLVVAAPVAVGLGVPGALLVLAACLLVLLRSRHHRVRAQALAAVLAGLAGLLALAAAASWLQPAWRLPVAVALVAAGGAVLAAGPASVRRGRLADLAESCVVASVPPLLVWASGVLELLRHGAGT